MTDTSSRLPICVHCGTARPADESLCPECGKPWIDVVVGDATPPAADAKATASVQRSSVTPIPPPPHGLDDTGEFDFDAWTLPPEPKSGRAKWLIPLILLIAVGAVWSLVFIERADTDSEPIAAAPETTTTLATTTTAQPTTSTPSSTTTTVPYPSGESWAAAGDPIPTPNLGLRASGIGPITFGTSLGEVAGVLVASLGPADTAGSDTDLCPSPEWYWLEWGALRVFFDGYTNDADFIAYRYEETNPGSSVVSFETLSGIRLGDTVEALQSTYGSYTVSFEVIEGRDFFRLLDGGELLLWGPVTSTEPEGAVEGIYSPDPCQT